MRNNTIILVIVGVLVAIALYIVLPFPHPAWLTRSEAAAQGTVLGLKLGLDLQGGTQVMLEADLPAGQAVPAGSMSTAQRIVENRVNGLGVSESVVQLQGDNRIITELPGVNNPDQAIETIRSTGQLEFVDPKGTQLQQGQIINTTNKPDAVKRAQDAAAKDTKLPNVQAPFPNQTFQTVMTGDVLKQALAKVDQNNQWEIGFLLTGEGSQKFYEYTSSHIGQQMAIVLDGKVLSAPVIQAAIRDQGVITGRFTQPEAESLAVQMQYGALPIPLKVVDISTIGATLGQDSVRRSLIAGLVGLLAVMVFMGWMYRIPGLLADLALVFYVFFNLAIYKFLPVTLTLAGIAGFLLSIGIAVDANVLIFERTKEELRNGRSPRLAIETGFSRAWPAIIDSNLTTIISCAVLYWFGTTFGASIVKGYALTLGLGVALSMFTAFVVTRAMMRALLGSRAAQGEAAHTIVGY